MYLSADLTIGRIAIITAGPVSRNRPSNFCREYGMHPPVASSSRAISTCLHPLSTTTEYNRPPEF